eukprot:3774597-Rhodomonas_salina.1
MDAGVGERKRSVWILVVVKWTAEQNSKGKAALLECSRCIKVYGVWKEDSRRIVRPFAGSPVSNLVPQLVCQIVRVAKLVGTQCGRAIPAWTQRA